MDYDKALEVLSNMADEITVQWHKDQATVRDYYKVEHPTDDQVDAYFNHLDMEREAEYALDRLDSLRGRLENMKRHADRLARAVSAEPGA